MKNLWIYKILIMIVSLTTLFYLLFTNGSIVTKINFTFDGIIIVYLLYIVIKYKTDKAVLGFQKTYLGTGLMIGIFVGTLIAFCFSKLDIQGLRTDIIAVCILIGMHVGYNKKQDVYHDVKND